MVRGRIVDRPEIRAFVIESVEAGHTNLVKRVRERFSVSRQTAHSYVTELVSAGVITRRSPGVFELAERTFDFAYEVSGLEEHRVWLDDVLPIVSDLGENVVDVLSYACTEMVNNVIDHSGSTTAQVTVTRSATETQIDVYDQGVGIFRKIAESLGLEDDRHAVLELSKGKVTTDPENHTGEGIFFTSRSVDRFAILSGEVYFSHEHGQPTDWILGKEYRNRRAVGTAVFMTMGNQSRNELQGVFNEYSSESTDYRFDRTVVPVRLMHYGDDRLVSRSQAKRLMTRFDRFRTVVLDFEDVPSVGQAFADEIFRVFRTQHPEIEVLAVQANEQVARMIARASNNTAET